MNFVAKKFSELTLDELYEILKSRAEIFLLEQKIICQDMDDYDKCSLHCFFFDGERVIACLRAFEKDAETVFMGRVLTLEHKKGLGTKLINYSIEEIKKHFNCSKICLHAQTQAVGFYEKMGFRVTSDEYLEEGVPHVNMERTVFDCSDIKNIE